jgi:hypothetical protein
VVHHENDGGIGPDLLQPRFVRVSEPHSIQGPGDAPGKPVTESKVDVGVEGGHDLLDVPLDLRHYQFTRHSLLDGQLLGGLHDLGVVQDSIDEDLSLGQFEGLDVNPKASIDLVQNPVDSPSKEPADTGHKEALEDEPDPSRGE